MYQYQTYQLFKPKNIKPKYFMPADGYWLLIYLQVQKSEYNNKIQVSLNLTPPRTCAIYFNAKYFLVVKHLH